MVYFMLTVALFLAPMVFWLVVSYSNLVNPYEVALRQWFGHLEEEILTSDNGLFESGLHFVPWFPGIKLVKIPKKVFRLLYEKDDDKPGSVMSGTMFGVRSSNKQKLNVEATFFLRFPYHHVESLISIIESGVPFEDEEELRDWIEDAIAPDVLYVFGQEKYEDVMGGTKNQELNEEVNKRLRGEEGPDSLLERCGLLGEDINDTTPGNGEAYLKIEDVHLSGPLGARLELVETARLEAEAARGVAEKFVETAKLQAEAAESTAHIKARVIGRPVEIMIDEWIAGEARRMNATTPEAIATLVQGLKDKGIYTQKLKEFHELRSRELAGGGTYNKQEVDLNSGGKPIDLAGLVAGAGAAALAWMTGRQSGPGSEGGPPLLPGPSGPGGSGGGGGGTSPNPGSTSGGSAKNKPGDTAKQAQDLLKKKMEGG